jgi:hypothetical protein
MMMKQKYPDRKPTYGIPYEGIEYLRPETQNLVKAFLAGKLVNSRQILFFCRVDPKGIAALVARTKLARQNCYPWEKAPPGFIPNP